MGKIRNWILEKMGVGAMVQKEVDNRLSIRMPTADENDQALLEYRQREYKLWANSNPDKLLYFYKTQHTVTTDGVMYNRQPFWRWVGTKPSVAKFHYPAPESILNYMKSLLFGTGIEITIYDDDKNKAKELNEIKDEMLEEININHLLQVSSFMETYSGTLAYRFVIDTDISDTPIIIPYPAERIEFTKKYDRAIEVIFKDYHKIKDKVYTQKSIYGYGYIDYELYNDKGKQVPLNAITQTEDLKPVVFKGKDGKPIKMLMCSWKQNRTHSNEFPEELYGGSDFEGIIDSFHIIDETYSTKVNYQRKTRPIVSYSIDALPRDKSGNVRKPKEWEHDAIELDPRQTADDLSKLIYRSVTEINMDGYDKAIEEEMKTIFQKIGIAYSSAGLISLPSNVSNEALTTIEKATVVTRDNKIALWKPFLIDTMILAFIYKDLIEAGVKENADGLIYTVDVEKYDFNIAVEFPDYHNQSFNEKLEIVSKAYREGLIDLKTAIEWLYEDLDEEQVKLMVVRIKQEQGNTLLRDEVDVARVLTSVRENED